MKYINILITIIFTLMFKPAVCSENQKDIKFIGKSDKTGYSKIYTVEDYLRFVLLFEDVINKKSPTISDCYKLGPEELVATACEEAWVGLWQKEYCNKILEINEDSNKCNKYLNKLSNDKTKRPSFRLNLIRKELIEDTDDKIIIFIDPAIKMCPGPDKSDILEKGHNDALNRDFIIAKNVNEYIQVPAISKSGNKYKSMIIEMPCTDTIAGINGYIIHVYIEENKY